ncbi:ankyrin repeat domain-containing protein, partial [bacterium]
MLKRDVPVRPHLDHLKRQAKELLRAIKQGDPAALAELQEHLPNQTEPATTQLAQAQFVLARSYGVASWPRLALACRMTGAIWENDVETVRELVLKNPNLLHEHARGTQHCNWGPPMSYAANIGRNEIVEMLRELGANDVQHAFERACLQSKLDTARRLYAMGARPVPGSVMGPCETLSGIGLEFQLELGAPLADEHGDALAPIGLILETYCRNPEGKHLCLEVLTKYGVELPDTPPMAVHRGRIDLLEEHLQRDPDLLSRTFSHEEIYPRALGCHEDPTLALNGTPTAGGTLLHLCVDLDEMEIAQWLLSRGADVNAKSTVDADGFGGHTALFGCVVSQPYRVG